MVSIRRELEPLRWRRSIDFGRARHARCTPTARKCRLDLHKKKEQVQGRFGSTPPCLATSSIQVGRPAVSLLSSRETATRTGVRVERGVPDRGVPVSYSPGPGVTPPPAALTQVLGHTTSGAEWKARGARTGGSSLVQRAVASKSTRAR